MCKSVPKVKEKSKYDQFSYFLCYPSLFLSSIPLPPLPFFAGNQLLPCTSIWARDDPQRGKEGMEVVKRWRKKGWQDGGRERMGATRRSGSEVRPACAGLFCVRFPSSTNTTNTTLLHTHFEWSLGVSVTPLTAFQGSSATDPHPHAHDEV